MLHQSSCRNRRRSRWHRREAPSREVRPCLCEGLIGLSGAWILLPWNRAQRPRQERTRKKGGVIHTSEMIVRKVATCNTKHIAAAPTHSAKPNLFRAPRISMFNTVWGESSPEVLYRADAQLPRTGLYTQNASLRVMSATAIARRF